MLDNKLDSIIKWARSHHHRDGKTSREDKGGDRGDNKSGEGGQEDNEDRLHIYWMRGRLQI